MLAYTCEHIVISLHYLKYYLKWLYKTLSSRRTVIYLSALLNILVDCTFLCVCVVNNSVFLEKNKE